MPSRFRAREKRSASGRGDSAALLLFTSDRVERAPSPALAVGGSDNIPRPGSALGGLVREAPRREAERRPWVLEQVCDAISSSTARTQYRAARIRYPPGSPSTPRESSALALQRS